MCTFHWAIFVFVNFLALYNIYLSHIKYVPYIKWIVKAHREGSNKLEWRNNKNKSCRSQLVLKIFAVDDFSILNHLLSQNFVWNSHDLKFKFFRLFKSTRIGKRLKLKLKMSTTLWLTTFSFEFIYGPRIMSEVLIYRNSNVIISKLG